MPDLGTVLAAVRYAGRFRRTAEIQRQQDEEERHRRDHPEDYVSVRDIFAEVIRKRKDKFPELAAKSAEPVPVPAVRCRHCEGVLDLSAVDLRALADAVDRRVEQQA